MNTRKILMLCAWLLAIGLPQAQTPQLIGYQAVARDLTGKVLSEKPISVQVEILQGGNQGTAVYTETHELTTTKTGTINLLIGGGNASAGTFAEIDWSKAPYFLRLGMKQGKETRYTEVSNTQMVSVPYALYAEKAGNVVKIEPDTPEIPKDDKSLFSLVPLYNGSYPTDLMTALNGGTIVIQNYSLLVFYIQYLTGTDLQLTAEIEGCEIDSSESTEYGRVYRFRNPSVESKDGINTTLTIKDKEGKILKSYPFIIKQNNLNL